VALASGTQLGPYQILAPLGAGGMGEVYRARDTRLEREVAVKVLPESLAGNQEALARFEREAKAVAALSHPNILALYDVGTHQGVSYAVTELLEGETLRSRLVPAALPWRKAAEVAAAIADGLSAAHAKGIVHRDLKPENIFLTTEGRVKILDFGLARLTQPEAGADSATKAAAAPTRTREGTVMGTAGYMSPEQVRGQRAEAPSDIFSLGCMLYEMVSGQRAFARETAVQTMTAVLESQPPELAGSGKPAPLELDRLVTHCLEKNPGERFQSARDLAFALRAVPGTEPAAPVAAGPGRRWRPAPVWIAGLAVFLAAVAGVFLWFGQGRAIDSLAVLPFVNAGGDPQAEYLSDGIAENLINSFSRLAGLRVVPRSRVFRYKGRDVDPLKAGRELNVRAVLTGRLVQREQALDIQAELVDVAADSQLWGGRYNRPLADLIAVQEEIAREVSAKLGVKQTGEQQKQLARRSTGNPEAYQLYLKGRYYWNRRTEATLKRAAEYFQQAIESDPGYGLAYAGLADCYAMYGNYAVLSPTETVPRAKAAARKALEIDETLAEAHASLAAVITSHEWDWAQGDREFRRAIELDARYATAHQWFAFGLWATGRFEEAVASAKRAQELEPLSPVISGGVGWALHYARRYDEAIDYLRKTLEMDPNFARVHWYLGMPYEQKGMYKEAIAEFEKALSLSGGSPSMMAALGHAYALAGRGPEARKILAQLQELSRARYISPFDIATVHAGLGDQERAFEWLEKSYADRSWGLFRLKVDPWFDRLRPDPRFANLLRRMNLAP